jgi:hypothetical protein
MQPDKAMKEQIAQRLREALDRVRSDLEKVDIWVGALGAFTQPIPEYELANRFKLPPAKKPDHSASNNWTDARSH